MCIMGTHLKCLTKVLEAPHWGTSNEYPSRFLWRKKKNIMWIPLFSLSYELIKRYVLKQTITTIIFWLDPLSRPKDKSKLCHWTASREKLPLFMHILCAKTCRFRSSCTWAKYHLGLCSPSIHSGVSNDSVLALTVKIRKSQNFLAPISGSPGDQFFSLTFRNSTSIFLNSHLRSKTTILKLNNT